MSTKPRKKISKKAFIHTLEVVGAMIITFLFVVYILPRYSIAGIEAENLGIMQRLKDDAKFRECVVDNDKGCIELEIRQELPATFNFTVIVSDNIYEKAEGLPEKRVLVESAYFAGSITKKMSRIVKVYYWQE